MPHISLGNDAPGIVSLFAYRPETAKPLCDLAEVLLRGPNSLTQGTGADRLLRFQAQRLPFLHATRTPRSPPRSCLRE